MPGRCQQIRVAGHGQLQLDDPLAGRVEPGPGDPQRQADVAVAAARHKDHIGGLDRAQAPDGDQLGVARAKANGGEERMLLDMLFHN